MLASAVQGLCGTMDKQSSYGNAAHSSLICGVILRGTNLTYSILGYAGVHVTLPDYYSPEHLGMIVPKTKDGRVVFMLPWLDATIAGTTGGCHKLQATHW